MASDDMSRDLNPTEITRHADRVRARAAIEADPPGRIQLKRYPSLDGKQIEDIYKGKDVAALRERIRRGYPVLRGSDSRSLTSGSIERVRGSHFVRDQLVFTQRAPVLDSRACAEPRPALLASLGVLTVSGAALYGLVPQGIDTSNVLVVGVLLTVFLIALGMLLLVGGFAVYQLVRRVPRPLLRGTLIAATPETLEVDRRTAPSAWAALDAVRSIAASNAWQSDYLAGARPQLDLGEEAGQIAQLAWNLAKLRSTLTDEPIHLTGDALDLWQDRREATRRALEAGSTALQDRAEALVALSLRLSDIDAHLEEIDRLDDSTADDLISKITSSLPGHRFAAEHLDGLSAHAAGVADVLASEIAIVQGNIAVLATTALNIPNS